MAGVCRRGANSARIAQGSARCRAIGRSETLVGSDELCDGLKPGVSGRANAGAVTDEGVAAGAGADGSGAGSPGVGRAASTVAAGFSIIGTGIAGGIADAAGSVDAAVCGSRGRSAAGV